MPHVNPIPGRRWWACFAAAVLLAALVTTAAGRLDRDDSTSADVTGRVLLDGKPLAGATVTFTPESGSPSTGRTDADGRFTLAGDGGPGVNVGRHNVRVVAGGPGQSGGFDSGEQLTREVHAGANDFTLEPHRTVNSFTGRLARGGSTARFAPRNPVTLGLVYKKTGESFGVPVRDDGTFEIGWMPVGEYSAVLTAARSNRGIYWPGSPGTYTIPGGLTIEAGKTDYTIDVGEKWSHQAPVPSSFAAPLSHADVRPSS
jgi:hypothetical protein